MLFVEQIIFVKSEILENESFSPNEHSSTDKKSRLDQNFATF